MRVEVALDVAQVAGGQRRVAVAQRPQRVRHAAGASARAVDELAAGQAVGARVDDAQERLGDAEVGLPGRRRVLEALEDEAVLLRALPRECEVGTAKRAEAICGAGAVSAQRSR